MAKNYKVRANIPKSALDAFLSSEDSRVAKVAAEKARRIREYRQEASRLASMANKRVARLERNGLMDTPAYQTYLKGGGKFGVRGKSYNEVQAEVARLNRFLNAQSSTVRGANNVAKQIASNTGIKYSNLDELRVKSARFFELASKAEQYARNVLDSASALGYQKIWDVINTLEQQNEIDLASAEASVDDMLAKVTDALDEFEPEPIDTLIGNVWFELDKD